MSSLATDWDSWDDKATRNAALVGAAASAGHSGAMRVTRQQREKRRIISEKEVARLFAQISSADVDDAAIVDCCAKLVSVQR